MTNYIAKIEGHGKLKIDFATGRAKLIIAESERLFEGLLLGKNMNDAPYITSRICGVCPTAHYMTSLKALENALGIRPTKFAISLRRIMLLAQIIQSHLLHLFFLALPDYIEVESALDIVKKSPSQFHALLNIKKAGEKILNTIGGRSVHPIRPIVGGFSKYPSLDELRSLRNDLENIFDEAIDFATLFLNLNYPELRVKTQYLALANLGNATLCQLPSNKFTIARLKSFASEKYPLYDGLIISSAGTCFEANDYKKHIKEKILQNSPAKKAYHKGKNLLVGAIARVNLNHNQLNPTAAKLLSKAKPYPVGSFNTFTNIASQATEVVNSIEEMLIILEDIFKNYSAEDKTLPKIKMPDSQVWGVGAIEAPRGTLYHAYEITPQGRIKNADIVTPTVQNLSNVEIDANQLLKINSHRSQKEQERLVEMLIRAYDPCITCSVH